MKQLTNQEKYIVKYYARKVINNIPQEIIPSWFKEDYVIRLTKNEKFIEESLKDYYQRKWNQQKTTD